MKTPSLTIKIPKDLHSEFKMAAIKLDKTMTDILIDHIKKVVKDVKNEKI